eukprot:4370465-Pyramimonas_sp.AAC.1
MHSRARAPTLFLQRARAASLPSATRLSCASASASALASCTPSHGTADQRNRDASNSHPLAWMPQGGLQLASTARTGRAYVLCAGSHALLKRGDPAPCRRDTTAAR